VKQTIRFLLDGVTYQVEVERTGDQLTLSREGERFTVSLLEGPPGPAAARPVRSSDPAPTSEAVSPGPTPASQPGLLHAPMTGLVKEVKVAVGAAVKKGDVVLVMEAMKMDVEVSAPVSGVVVEVKVSAGLSVEARAPLLVIQS
jgi:glutaconyl-CoA/methylmalonyl-CoA decarboxylase subunit gamma